MFAFGQNWAAYSQVLTPARLAAAQASLVQLLGTEHLSGRSFLDVGFGSGVFSICASRLGAAPVVGIDLDPTCREVAQTNASRYAPSGAALQWLTASVLDEGTIKSLGIFDVVYGWGSLHHTGNMSRAIAIAADRVAPGGILAIAIYNRHVTSPAWWQIKRIYNGAPHWMRLMMVAVFIPIIFLAKWAATWQNPLRKERGMSFMYDVVDWVGGFPYEYASVKEIVRQVEPLGFQTRRVIPAQVPTGCNEFVFVRQGTPSERPCGY